MLGKENAGRVAQEHQLVGKNASLKFPMLEFSHMHIHIEHAARGEVVNGLTWLRNLGSPEVLGHKTVIGRAVKLGTIHHYFPPLGEAFQEGSLRTSGVNF